MVESVGQQLQRARLQKKISVEYAAKATRIRPDRIVDLEHDDYTNFPNLAYAKGFLVIYAKYLGVDIAEFTRAFETGNPVSIDDYEYLSNPPEPLPKTVTYERGHGGERRWGGPTVGTVFIILLLFIFAGALVLYFWVSAQRLGILKPHEGAASPAATVTPAVKEPEASPAPALRASPPETTEPKTAGIPMDTPAPAVEPSPTAVPQQPGEVPGQPAQPTPAPTVQPTPPADQLPAASPGPSLEPFFSPAASAVRQPHKIEIKPLKKTWVVIRQGGSASLPVFEDYIYPDSDPLHFSGNNFFIQAYEDNSVEIRKDGQPVPYEAPGITIE